MRQLLAALAAWRIARMMVVETGPLGAFERLRFEVAKHTTPGGWIDEGFSCVLCVSFWAALILALLITDRRREFLVNWLGIAGGAAAIHLITEGE